MSIGRWTLRIPSSLAAPISEFTENGTPYPEQIDKQSFASPTSSSWGEVFLPQDHQLRTRLGHLPDLFEERTLADRSRRYRDQDLIPVRT